MAQDNLKARRWIQDTLKFTEGTARKIYEVRDPFPRKSGEWPPYPRTNGENILPAKFEPHIFPPPTPLSLMWQMYTHKFSAPVTVLSLCLSTRIPSFWEYQDTESRLFRVFEKTWHLVWERSQEYQIHCYWSESLLMHKQQMFNYGNFQSQVQRAENLQGPNTPKCSCNLLALCGIGTWNIGKDSLPCKDWLKKQAWKLIFIVFSTIGRCIHTRKYS